MTPLRALPSTRARAVEAMHRAILERLASPARYEGHERERDARRLEALRAEDFALLDEMAAESRRSAWAGRGTRPVVPAP